VAQTVGAEDTDLWKEVTDKWEGASQMGLEKATPHPRGGEDEGRAEKTSQMIPDDPSYSTELCRNP